MGKSVRKADDNPLLIPFGRAVRVGNFKLWRSRTSVGSGKDRTGIETVNVSNLDGTWKVQIPSTSTLFGVIVSNFATVDEKLREQFLAGEVFSNLEAINTCGSVVLHHSFRMLFNALSYPMLFMSEKELTSWVKKNFEAGDKKQMKQHLENLLKERKEFYELIEKERKNYLEVWEEQRSKIKSGEEEAQKQLVQDEIAEQAMEILTENGE